MESAAVQPLDIYTGQVLPDDASLRAAVLAHTQAVNPNSVVYCSSTVDSHATGRQFNARCRYSKSDSLSCRYAVNAKGTQGCDSYEITRITLEHNAACLAKCKTLSKVAKGSAKQPSKPVAVRVKPAIAPHSAMPDGGTATIFPGQIFPDVTAFHTAITAHSGRVNPNSVLYKFSTDTHMNLRCRYNKKPEARKNASLGCLYAANASRVADGVAFRVNSVVLTHLPACIEQCKSLSTADSITDQSNYTSNWTSKPNLSDGKVEDSNVKSTSRRIKRQRSLTSGGELPNTHSKKRKVEGTPDLPEPSSSSSSTLSKARANTRSQPDDAITKTLEELGIPARCVTFFGKLGYHTLSDLQAQGLRPDEMSELIRYAQFAKSAIHEESFDAVEMFVAEKRLKEKIDAMDGISD